jgi:hypothetical protein
VLAGAGLIEDRLEFGMFAAPFVTRGTVDAVLAGGGGDRLPGNERGDHLGLDGGKIGHTFSFAGRIAHGFGSYTRRRRYVIEMARKIKSVFL